MADGDSWGCLAALATKIVKIVLLGILGKRTERDCSVALINKERKFWID